jgi:putative ABC transport system permease protein
LHGHLYGGPPLGIKNGPPSLPIVGVVESIKSGGLQDPAPPQIYMPTTQRPVPVLTAVLRAAGDPAALGRTVQQAVLSVDPDVPAYRLRTGDQLLGRSLARRRLLMTLISSFAAIALVLALLGLYGVLAYGCRSARARSVFAWLWVRRRGRRCTT